MWIASRSVVILAVYFTYVCCHDNPPNIVFIMMDDIGWNDVGYHNSSIYTPNIDAIVNDGVRLENYYVGMVCTPTRGMFLTGKHMINLQLQDGIIGGHEPKCLPVNEVTVAQKLKEYNYVTHAIGKWHLGYYKEACLPINRGFDSFFGIIGGETDHYTHRKNLWWELYRDDKSVSHQYNGIYSTDLYAREARTIIANHNDDKPMFMYLAFQAAHVPLQAPDEYVKMYSNIEDPDRRNYAAMVTCMDDAIGSVVDQLKLSGLWDNTILVVSTDNGGAHASGNNWPLKGSKASLWEGGVRGVGFVASPLLDNQIRGSSNHQLMHVTDWLPTFVKVAGGDSNSIGSMNLYGVDQWNTISKNHPSMRDNVLINLVPETMLKNVKAEDPWLKNDHFDVKIKAAVRVGNWKLLTGQQAPEIWYAAPESDQLTRHGSDDRIVRLYNIAEDPTESNNLADSRPAKVLECLKKLEEYRSKVLPILDTPSISDKIAERLMPNHVLAPWDRHNKKMHF